MATVKIWTYAAVDFGLMRDDPESVETLIPRRAWTDRAKAEQALQRELDEYLDDVFEDEPYNRPRVSVDELRWLDDHGHDLKCWKTFIEEIDTRYYLYEMELDA